MSDILRRWRAQGREYIEYPDNFIKRSLAPDEYNERIVDPYHYSSLNMRKLQNEAECLKFVARETSVPVPRVLATYERDGSFILETERIDGILMQDLKPEEQLEVMPQIRDCLQELHSLRSNKLGGPSGIICPPQAIMLRPTDCKSWSQTNISTSEYVFCHRDLSQANVFVHPTSLQVLAIVDWECGGYYPESHELPFFESPEWSGVQVKKICGMKEIKDFWKKAAVL
jgi:Phosphotransferase enzyme family